MKEKDWQGRDVEANEPDETNILVWEVEPHIQSRDHDSCLIRGWQDMLENVRANLDMFLESFEVDELKAGVSIKVRLVEMRKCDYEEIVVENI